MLRILADENCPADLVTELQTRGHDIIWIRSDAPGTSDPAILARAQHENRIILTFDKDFGELAFRLRQPAQRGIILCRLSGLNPSQMIQVIVNSLESRPNWDGYFVVITQQRIRVIPL